MYPLKIGRNLTWMRRCLTDSALRQFPRARATRTPPPSPAPTVRMENKCANLGFFKPNFGFRDIFNYPATRTLKCYTLQEKSQNKKAQRSIKIRSKPTPMPRPYGQSNLMFRSDRSPGRGRPGSLGAPLGRGASYATRPWHPA